MKKLLFSVMVIVLLAATWIPASAEGGGGDTVAVLILAKGSTDALVSQIEAAGGTVKYQYKNVPAVAAEIPASQWDVVSTLPGVVKVEKDSIVYLDDDPTYGKSHGAPNFFTVEEMEGVEVQAVDPEAIDVEALPEGYANFLYTGAFLAWLQTGFGAGSVVAVVDTGTTPVYPCLTGSVIGAPGYPEGYNATGDGVSPIDPTNHWHGTFVGGVIASHCVLDFSSDPTNPLYQAISAYLPWPPNFVPVIGQAPAAKLYPVKVFPQDGSGVPTSVILDGLDHILTLKKNDLLDIDIVNMSLGGPTVYDGRDTFDTFIRELKKARMLVVTSAGNDGPTPNSVGSPATSYDSLSVGALDYAPSSRVLYEYLGLTRGPDGVPYNGDEGPGMGMVMRPTDETRVANFSSRGPLSDGRAGPDMSALGLWNFQQAPQGYFMWAGGTSFSAPTVSGGAALLNAWWEAQGKETHPIVLRKVLMGGANPYVVGPAWQDINTQGWGALNVPASLFMLQTKNWHFSTIVKTGALKSNILPKAKKNKVDTWESDVITLNPSESIDLVWDISRYTSKVTIEVFDVTTPDNSAYAYWPNALEVRLQSAKRTAVDHPVGVYWYPFWYGDSFDIVVEDGPWTFWGIPWTYQPMEPGKMKLTLIGDFSNEAPVSFKVRVTRENFRTPLRHPVAAGPINQGDAFLVPVSVDPGTSRVTFDLNWHRKWNKFPTSDIDMFVFDSAFNLVSWDGATLNAPERAVIDNPTDTLYYVYIQGYEMYKPDYFKLYVTTE